MNPNCERYNLTAIEELLLKSLTPSYDDPVTIVDASRPEDPAAETSYGNVRKGDYHRIQDGIVNSRTAPP